MASLIQYRFYDVSRGDILIDGQSLVPMDVGVYRNVVSLVAQEPTIYQGTPTHNLGTFRSADADINLSIRNNSRKHLHWCCTKCYRERDNPSCARCLSPRFCIITPRWLQYSLRKQGNWPLWRTETKTVHCACAHPKTPDFAS